MAGSLATFEPHLQEAIDAGCLGPAAAWKVMWEFYFTPGWTPAGYDFAVRVDLFHLPMDGDTLH